MFAHLREGETAMRQDGGTTGGVVLAANAPAAREVPLDAI